MSGVQYPQKANMKEACVVQIIFPHRTRSLLLPNRKNTRAVSLCPVGEMCISPKWGERRRGHGAERVLSSYCCYMDLDVLRGSALMDDLKSHLVS